MKTGRNSAAPDGQHAPPARVPVALERIEPCCLESADSGPRLVVARRLRPTDLDDDLPEAGKSLRAVCVDLQSGKLLQNIEVFRVEQPESINPKNSYASPTPVIEAGRVYVHFGTNGSACLDTASGSILWTNRNLKLDQQRGPGSSPILYEGLFIVHCDGMDVQHIVALDKHSGKIAWDTNRTGKPHDNPDFRKAYSTPLADRRRQPRRAR